MEVVWSASSFQRLEQIGDFIAKDSPANAKKFIKTLIDAVERLKEFPFSGAVALENPAFRQITEQGYRIIYCMRKEELIEIVTVVSPGLNFSFDKIL